jgi:hypothetical protein
MINRKSLEQAILGIFSIFLANYLFPNVPFSSVTVRLRSAIALIRQHIIISSGFKSGASSLNQHLAGSLHRVPGRANTTQN